jgi:hypothetical protein
VGEAGLPGRDPQALPRERRAWSRRVRRDARGRYAPAFPTASPRSTSSSSAAPAAAPNPQPPRRRVGLATAEVEGARSAPAPRSASRHRPARCRSCCRPAPGPAPPLPPTSACRHACPPAHRLAQPRRRQRAAGKQRLGGPAGRLAEVVRRTTRGEQSTSSPGARNDARPPRKRRPDQASPLRGSSSFQPHTRCASGPHTISDSGRGCWLAASSSEAGPPQRSGPAARSPRRPRTPRPMLRIGPAHLPPAPRPPGRKVIHAATGRPPPDGRASVDQEPQGTR